MSDAEEILRILGDPKAMTHYPSVYDLDGAKDWVRRNQRRYKTHGVGQWLALFKNSNAFAGMCGLIPQEVESVEELEIGYLFLRQFWNQGLATEAAKCCRDYAFQDLGRDRVISLIDVNNRPSQRVAEKLGMKIERRIMKWERNILVYALQKKENAVD